MSSHHSFMHHQRDIRIQESTHRNIHRPLVQEAQRNIQQAAQNQTETHHRKLVHRIHRPHLMLAHPVMRGKLLRGLDVRWKVRWRRRLESGWMLKRMQMRRM
jgi:hypothetical protein